MLTSTSTLLFLLYVDDIRALALRLGGRARSHIAKSVAAALVVDVDPFAHGACSAGERDVNDDTSEQEGGTELLYGWEKEGEDVRGVEEVC